MKAKYEKMIDEYVKKHYGDLERGVLAPEVKYKVLWKIYRKKYRKEKNMWEHLEETVKDWCRQNKALELPEDLDRKLFPRHLAPSPDKVLPKEDGFNHLAEGFKKFLDLHEVCGNCVHFREGKGKDKSTCAKHDKFVTETCSCYEFEDKAQKEMKTCDRCKYSTFKTVTNGREAATGKMWCTKNDFETSGITSCDWFEDNEDSYLDWLHDDITWCCRECSDTNCERNSRNRRCKEGLFSVADMYDPFKCPVDAEMPKQP